MENKRSGLLLLNNSKKEMWLKRLEDYIDQIEKGLFLEKQMPFLVDDIINSVKFQTVQEPEPKFLRLKQLLPKLRPMFAEFFECSINEIFVGGAYDDRENDCPYKIVLGSCVAYPKSSRFETLDLSNLQIVVGDLIVAGTRNVDLSNLVAVTGILNLEDCENVDISNIQSVSYLRLQMAKNINLSGLETITQTLDAERCCDVNLSGLKIVVEDVLLEHAINVNLKNLEKVGGHLFLGGAANVDVSNLEMVGKEASFEHASKIDARNLKQIGSNAFFNFADNVVLENLQTILGNANCRYAKNTLNLAKLKKIGGNAYFDDSQIQNLESLEEIGGDANFKGAVCQTKQLKTIGGNAYFLQARQTDLSNLTTIGGDAMFVDSKIEKLGKLSIGKSLMCNEKPKFNICQIVCAEKVALFDESQSKLPCWQFNFAKSKKTLSLEKFKAN